MSKDLTGSPAGIGQVIIHCAATIYSPWNYDTQTKLSVHSCQQGHH